MASRGTGSPLPYSRRLLTNCGECARTRSIANNAVTGQAIQVRCVYNRVAVCPSDERRVLVTDDVQDVRHCGALAASARRCTSNRARDASSRGAGRLYVEKDVAQPQSCDRPRRAAPTLLVLVHGNATLMHLLQICLGDLGATGAGKF